MIKKICLLLTFLLFISCVDSNTLIKKYAPSVKLKSVNFKALYLDGFDIEASFIVKNNKINKDIVILKQSYSLFVDEVFLTKLNNLKLVKLPAGKEKLLKQSFNVKFKNAFRIIKKLFIKDIVDIRIKGDFKIGAPIEKTNFVFNYTFKTRVPKLPQIKLENIKITGINSVIMIFNLTNKHNAPIYLAPVYIKLYINNEKILQGKSKKISIKKNEAITVKVPVKLDIVKAIKLLPKIKNFRKLKFKIKGYFTLNTPVKNIKIPFSL